MPSRLDEIVSFAKRRGFIYQTSEIYGGLANAYDLGPLGVELMRRIEQTWWQTFISQRDDMVGLDSQILLHPKTWEASGHVGSFTDPLVEDKVNHKRYRADHLIEDWLETNQDKLDQESGDINVEAMSTDQMAEFIKNHQIKSPDGNPITEPKDFNILFETSIGSVDGQKTSAYLRGETAQGIFTNFKQVLDSTRVQLPFGIGQIGKSFRNEITTGQFVFRTLEFSQAEIEYFFDPETEDWQDLFKSWQESMWMYVTEVLGISSDKLRWRRHDDNERSHYSKETYDLDYQFPFGWKELWGIAYRTDYDLKQHQKFSGKKLKYRDPYSGKTFIPHVIEPALGLNRVLLMLLDHYYKQTDEDKPRQILALPENLTAYKAAVFPLLANKPELVAKAEEIRSRLKRDLPQFQFAWDARGNIGKRYASQDEIGTPWCITIDFDTLEDDSVTIRNRDTGKQTRVESDRLSKALTTNTT